MTAGPRSAPRRQSVIGFGGSVHLHAPTRPARPLNRGGSLNGTAATTMKGTGFPLIRICAYCHCRAAVTAACSRRLHRDQSMRACATVPEAVTLSSRKTTPSSPAPKRFARIDGPHILAFLGRGPCPQATAESKQVAMVADMLKVVRARCFTHSLDTHSAAKFTPVPTRRRAPSRRACPRLTARCRASRRRWSRQPM